MAVYVEKRGMLSCHGDDLGYKQATEVSVWLAALPFTDGTKLHCLRMATAAAS